MLLENVSDEKDAWGCSWISHGHPLLKIETIYLVASLIEGGLR